MRYALLIALIACPFMAMADDELSLKLFAGIFKSAAELQSQLRSEASLTTATTSVIPCDSGTQFGVAYMLRIDRKTARKSKSHVFRESWSHPPVSGQRLTERDLQVSFKRRQSDPKFAGWQLMEETMIDGDITLTITRDDNIHLKHVFQVMGCTPESRSALDAALTESEAKELVCEQIMPVGSRIPETVCRSRAHFEAARESAQREVKRRQNSGTATGGGGGTP